MKTVFSVISIIGILVVLEGIVFLLKPAWAKKTISFFSQGRFVYLAGVIRILLGVLFLIYARGCVWTWFVIIFGLLMCAAGVCVFLINIDKLKAYLNWWLQRSDITIRIISVVAIILGSIIFYAGTPK